MEEQFYIVTGFYPAQRLTIHVNQFHIMDIMNCDTDTARELLKKIGKEVGNEFTPCLRTSDFCYYMDIDEMLIQVFLASIHTDTAREMLREVRDEDDDHNSKQRKYVSIKKFCAVHKKMITLIVVITPIEHCNN